MKLEFSFSAFCWKEKNLKWLNKHAYEAFWRSQVSGVQLSEVVLRLLENERFD